MTGGAYAARTAFAGQPCRTVHGTAQRCEVHRVVGCVVHNAAHRVEHGDVGAQAADCASAADGVVHAVHAHGEPCRMEATAAVATDERDDVLADAILGCAEDALLDTVDAAAELAQDDWA